MCRMKGCVTGFTMFRAVKVRRFGSVRLCNWMWKWSDSVATKPLCVIIRFILCSKLFWTIFCLSSFCPPHKNCGHPYPLPNLYRYNVKYLVNYLLILKITFKSLQAIHDLYRQSFEPGFTYSCWPLHPLIQKNKVFFGEFLLSISFQFPTSHPITA